MVILVMIVESVHCKIKYTNQMNLAPNLYPNDGGSHTLLIIIFFKMEPDKFTALIRENKSLRSQLREANLTIHSLKQEISQLQERLSHFENDESTWNNILPDNQSNEIFTQSSESSIEELNGNLFFSEKVQSQQIPQQAYSRSVIRHPISQIDENPSPRIIFNYEQSENSMPRILRQKKISLFEGTPNREKLTHKPSDQEYSAIKIQQPIMNRGVSNQIVQRVNNYGKKIYETFFVTGYSFQKLAPSIDYFYPASSNHFDAVLSLVYTQSPLRPYEIYSGGRSPRNPSKRGKLDLKQTFVIPLCSDKEEERSYLVACEVQDYLQGLDGAIFCFSRMFCFITRCRFFSELNKILNQFVDKINRIKSPLLKFSPLPPSDTQDFLTEQLSDHLKILYSKNVQKNQYANFGLGDQIKIFIDVLPEEREFQYLLQYQQWKILSTSVYLAMEEDFVGRSDHAELLGYLLTYLISENKVLLFSASKSKVSEAVLHILEIIKPLEYINPIIMGAAKDGYQEYMGAPMPVLLGLWGEAKKKKQKIEIFMNKKPNFQGMIEDGKLRSEDGVVFNLDTGYIFGEGLCLQKNKIATDLNSLISKQCRSSKQVYRLFRRLIEGNFMLQSSELKNVSESILGLLKNTQIYSYYGEKLTKMLHTA